MTVEPSSPAQRFLETYSTAGGSAEAGVSVRRHEQIFMATFNVLLLVDRGHSPAGEELDRAAAGAFELMGDLENELSRFLPESEVSLMNALAAARPVVVSENLFELLVASRRYWEITRGAFDPTVAPLVRAWDFDSGVGRVPDGRELEQVLELCGMQRVGLDLERGRVSFERPGVSVDLGAIGKGYIVDRAVAHLKERGVRDGALLSGRSTITVWGKPPGADRWRIGVASPLAPEEVCLELEVEEGTISSSAAYERKFTLAGEEFGHVLDPRSGRPVKRSLGATVWTVGALHGDVASTALFVLGREEGGAILEDLAPISAIFLERDSTAPGGVRPIILHRGAPGFEVVRE